VADPEVLATDGEHLLLPDDGACGPERDAGGAKRRSAGGMRFGEGRAVAPPQYGLLGLCPRKIFKKSMLKLHIFCIFCKLKRSHLQSQQGVRLQALGLYTVSKNRTPVICLNNFQGI